MGVHESLDRQLLDRLVDQLGQATAEREGVAIERVALGRGLDPDGDPALFVTITLSSPPAGKETWPVGDVQRLRKLVRDAILELLHDDLRWYVNLEQEDADALVEQ